MEISHDYWDFVETIIATPVTILKEQADFLTKNTKGILVGEISFEGDFFYGNVLIPHQVKKMAGNAALNIKVPILGYTYQLLSIHYDIKENYPVHIVFDNQLFTTESEDDFKKNIQTILKSEASKKIIQNLYSQGKVFEKKANMED